jgi:hypothetical protein
MSSLLDQALKLVSQQHLPFVNQIWFDEEPVNDGMLMMNAQIKKGHLGYWKNCTVEFFYIARDLSDPQRDQFSIVFSEFLGKALDKKYIRVQDYPGVEKFTAAVQLAEMVSQQRVATQEVFDSYVDAFELNQ